MSASLAALVREKLLEIERTRFRSRREFAEAANMSESGLRAILKDGGHDGVTLKTLDKLLQAANVPPGELFTQVPLPLQSAAQPCGFYEESDPGAEAAQRLRILSVSPEASTAQAVALGLAEASVGLVRAGRFEMASQLLNELHGIVRRLLDSDYTRQSRVPGISE